ncbi:MAG: (d)CMP kinase [Thermoanaerobaculia bacterium]|nr:(d)CMP kinase [Thermoanaerobaculia bacterium]
MTVAIDGPAGVGKSSVARELARRLELSYLDTGAMYRAIALVADRRNIGEGDSEALAGLIAEEPLELRPDALGVARILVAGEDVEGEIRTPKISLLASRFAVQPVVRRYLVRLQQDFGRRYGAVLEGRDIGTVVFPHSPYKFFLEARPEVRADRRVGQLEASGKPTDRNAILADILERDRRDRGRTESPLRADATYTVVDTSELTLDQVIDRVEADIISSRKAP